MVKTLTQSIEQIDVNGQTWTQRRGSPSGGKNKENKKENAVVFIHGLGSRAYTFRQVSVLLQEKGYETFAPDVVGHGDSEKPSSNGGFKYDERSYVDAMETYVEKVANGKQVDLVAQGYIIPLAILLARSDRICLANNFNEHAVGQESQFGSAVALYANVWHGEESVRCGVVGCMGKVCNRRR